MLCFPLIFGMNSSNLEEFGRAFGFIYDSLFSIYMSNESVILKVFPNSGIRFNARVRLGI